MMLGGSFAATWLSFLTERQFLGNEVWRWVTLFGVLLCGFVLGRIVSFALQNRADRMDRRSRFRILAMLLRSAAGPVTLLALGVALRIAGRFMNLTLMVKKDGSPVPDTWLRNFWDQVCQTITAIAVGWFIYRLVDVIEHFLHRRAAKTETLLDDQLVPVIRKTLRVFVVVVVLLYIAQAVFDKNIATLLAGLGIGGLAFALAAKDMLANLFGSATIFADRPFQMGELVKIKGCLGTVEGVGFRSTRLRQLNGHLVTIPNSVVANEAIENISRRPSIRRVLDVTITYDTPPEKVRRGVDIIREMLDARKQHFPPLSPPRVYFSDYNAASLNIVVYYWFVPADWWQYLEFNHDFNMELLQRFGAEGIEFAFPTQTLYLKGDSDFPASVDIAGERSKS